MISSNSALVIQSRCTFESFRKKNFADKEAWVQTASYTQATKLIPLKKSGASLTVNSRIHVNFGFKCKVSKHDWFNDHIPHDASGNKEHSKGGREERITIWNINLKYYIQETQENFNSSPGPDKHTKLRHLISQFVVSMHTMKTMWINHIADPELDY